MQLVVHQLFLTSYNPYPGFMHSTDYKEKIVYTYRIHQSHNGNYTLQTSSGVEEKFFKTLEELIRHYKRRRQGLAQHLRHGIKRKTQLQLPAPCDTDDVPDYENVESDYVVVLPS
ncbi:SH2 domain-containing protein 1A isoform X2 [Esox lucius]|uniref:SH2 domain-containing protein 1A isoform X2 n=1 Tax=Esox lucius TaxID=8010 RepID=UPI001476DD6E|nr:SH2 domain-containing protein 1A isoform X2 [Esox lucius]